MFYPVLLCLCCNCTVCALLGTSALLESVIRQQAMLMCVYTCVDAWTAFLPEKLGEKTDQMNNEQKNTSNTKYYSNRID